MVVVLKEVGISSAEVGNKDGEVGRSKKEKEKEMIVVISNFIQSYFLSSIFKCLFYFQKMLKIIAKTL